MNDTESTAVVPSIAMPAPPAVIDKSTGEILAERDPTIGISECPITETEAAILTAPLDPETEIDIRWDGAIFMPGDMIRARLIRAFGPGRWATKAECPPRYDPEGGEIACDESLWIKGHYVSRATGCWQWNPKNPRMTKGDALESAHTETLRRLCKVLGIGAECWNRRFVDDWKAKYATTYVNQKGKTCWKRKSATQVAEHDALADEVAAAFDGYHPGLGEHPKGAGCPQCGKPLAERMNKAKGTPFWGCTGYPKCRYTQNVAPEKLGNAPVQDDPDVAAKLREELVDRWRQAETNGDVDWMQRVTALCQERGITKESATYEQLSDLLKAIDSYERGDAE